MSKQLIFVNHTADHSPGDVVTVDDAEAQRLVDAAMARYATEEEVEAALAVAEADAEDDADEKPKADASNKAKAETAKQA